MPLGPSMSSKPIRICTPGPSWTSTNRIPLTSDQAAKASRISSSHCAPMYSSKRLSLSASSANCWLATDQVRVGASASQGQRCLVRTKASGCNVVESQSIKCPIIFRHNLDAGDHAPQTRGIAERPSTTPAPHPRASTDRGRSRRRSNLDRIVSRANAPAGFVRGSPATNAAGSRSWNARTGSCAVRTRSCVRHRRIPSGRNSTAARASPAAPPSRARHQRTAPATAS